VVKEGNTVTTELVLAAMVPMLETLDILGHLAMGVAMGLAAFLAHIVAAAAALLVAMVQEGMQAELPLA
jgi:hypothetical protein